MVFRTQEQPLLTAYSPNIWIRQLSATQLYIEHSSNFSVALRVEISAITGLSLNERNLAVTNQKSVLIYKIPRTDEFKAGIQQNGGTNGNSNSARGNVSISFVQSFNVFDCMNIFIYDETIIVVGYQNVRIYSFGGIVLKEINFNDNEGMQCTPADQFAVRPLKCLANWNIFFPNSGTPIGASLTRNFMTIFTMNGFLKLYDISRHEPKLIIPAKAGYDLFGNFGEIIMAKCNVAGTQIALTIANESLTPDGKLYIWDTEKDRLYSFDFLNKQSDTGEADKKDAKDGSTDPNAFVRR